MRLLKFSLISAALGVGFFALSYGAASRLEQSKNHSYPESIARHYAQVSGKVFGDGTFGSGQSIEFNKSIPVDPAMVDSIDIETTAVDVELLLSETDELQVSLTSTRVNPDEPVLIDTSRGKTIRIGTQEGKSEGFGRRGWMKFDFSSDDSLDPARPQDVLQIRIPQSIIRGQVRTVSGDASIDAEFKTLGFQSKSGDLRMLGLSNPKARVEQLTVDTVSGDFKTRGRFERLQFNSVSGDIDISGLSRVLDISAHSVSGNLLISTAQPLDIDVTFVSKSGSATVEKELGVQSSLANSPNFRVGKGTTRLNFQTVSGDLKIERTNDEDADRDTESNSSSNGDSSSSDDSDASSSGAGSSVAGSSNESSVESSDKNNSADDSAATSIGLASPPSSGRIVSPAIAGDGYLSCVARDAVRTGSRIGAVATHRCVRFLAVN